MTAPIISIESYRIFQNFLAEKCGIRLGENKQYLVANRLSQVCQNAATESVDELITKLNSGRLGAAVVAQIIDAMTTNETFWFREKQHFDELTTGVFPKLADSGSMVRFWSAACSSGQEPYSLNMALDEYNRANPVRALSAVQIVATDISKTMLERARRGGYSEFELSRGLNIAQRARYFESVQQDWRLRREFGSRVQFQVLNLQQPFTSLGQFDVIFCRNVLIYFSAALKTDILQRLANQLKVGGYLFLSSTEAMPNGVDNFELVKNSSVRYFRRRS